MAASVLLLDLDGTLVDSNGAHARAFADTAVAFGVPVPRDRFDRILGKGGDLAVPDVFGPAFEREHGDDYRDAMGERFREVARSETFQVFDGAVELAEMARARGFKTALATSSAEDDLDALFESAGVDFRDLVDYVTTASDVDDSKPNPDLVEVVAEHFGMPTAACVLIGDTIYDVAAARRGGAASVGVSTWVWSEDDLAHHGARATYASTAALADRLDEALARASPGPTELTAEVADQLMSAALDEARSAFMEGDAAIGAVIANQHGAVVARGCNRASSGDPLRHAETEALHDLQSTEAAGEGGLVLVTSLEPCAMCLGAATEAGVHAVLYPLEAPPNGAAGRLDPLPGRRLPLVSRWRGADGWHRAASLDLLRQSAVRDGGFAWRLVEAVEEGEG